MLYPLRFVCESLKCSVTWEESTGTASVTRADGTVTTVRVSGNTAESDAMTAEDTLCVENDRILDVYKRQVQGCFPVVDDRFGAGFHGFRRKRERAHTQKSRRKKRREKNACVFHEMFTPFG